MMQIGAMLEFVATFKQFLKQSKSILNKLKRLSNSRSIQQKNLPTSYKMKTHIINTVKEILSFLFPFEELDDRPSVMIQDSWLSKIMRPTQIQDYLWHNEVK